MNKENNEELTEKKDDGKKKKKLLLIFILVFVLVFCGVYYGMQYYYNSTEPEPPTVKTTAPKDTGDTTGKLADNPIDFKELQKQNDDIYAWLEVKGTNVNHPVVQSLEDDAFYLKHDAYTKEWADKGAVYTEMHNHKSFNDPITIIYGHNGYGDTMFTTLHKFEKSDFFEKHENFVIYTRGRKLTYQIISAFKYDNRHILNSFNFADTAVLEDFQKMIQAPNSAVKNVRESDTIINKDSKIVILSTCITNQKSNRYLVCGVLVKDEKTN